MATLRILSIIIAVSLIILGMEFSIKLKKNQEKTVNEIMPSLLVRFNIMMVLTISLAVIQIVRILLSLP